MASTPENRELRDATSFISLICAALAIYNAIELSVLIFTTFKSYHGLYFWSMIIATFGIIPYVAGMEIMFFGRPSYLSGLIVNNIGWILMVVAQSVVLYSRLGLVLDKHKSRILAFTKWMIIIDAITFYTLATVIVFGMHYSENPAFTEGYIYVERLQMTGFCIQEFIISGLYIWKTLDFLQAGEKRQAHQTLRQLFIINVIIVALDIALLVLEYLSLVDIQIAFKALVYSVKLKMEFAILSKLVESSSLAQRSASGSLNNITTFSENEADSKVRESSFMPQWITPILSRRQDSRINTAVNVGKHQSDEAVRTTSHQTVGSDAHLLSPSTSGFYQTASSRKKPDPYHDALRAMSNDQT